MSASWSLCSGASRKFQQCSVNWDLGNLEAPPWGLCHVSHSIPERWGGGSVVLLNQGIPLPWSVQSFHPEHHAAYPDLPSSNRAEEASHTWLYTEWWRKDLFGPLVLKLAHQEHRTHLLFAVTQSWRYHTDALSNISKLSVLVTAPEGGCEVRADEKKQLFILCQSESYWDKPTVMLVLGFTFWSLVVFGCNHRLTVSVCSSVLPCDRSAARLISLAEAKQKDSSCGCLSVVTSRT